MKITISAFVMFLISITGFSQNLVENPSFESVNAGSLLCSWYTSQAQFAAAINGWTAPTGGSTDVFNMGMATTCYCHPLSTHASSPGTQLPLTGNSMCNITVYGPGGCTPYREYLQGHLTSPLVPGQQYQVQFYVSMGDKNTYATNNLGVYFTTTQTNVASMCVYSVTPQLNYTGAPITNSTGWVPITFTYTATAAYQYFILGNFYSDAATTTVNMGGTNGTLRYFVDDVSITPINSVPTSTFTVTTPICFGNSSTVTYTGTGTAGATYNWNWNGGTAVPGTGQGPHTVTWPGPGTYNVSLTVTEGAQTSTLTTHTVVVNPVPTATFTATSPVCMNSNSTITYTGSATAGASYTWNFDGGTIVSGSGQGPYQVYWTTAGTHNISLTVNQNGCTGTYTLPVLVNPIPNSSFTLISPVCVGNSTTVTYTGTAGAGANYAWNFNGGIVDSGSGQGPYQVHWNTQGTYNISLTVTENGCSSTLTSQPIVVNAIPTSSFSISQILCFGGNATVTYTGSAGTGANYAWDFGGGTVVSGSGQGPYQINWPSTGVQTVSLEVNEGGCVSGVTNVNVTNPTEMVASVSTNSVSCFSGNNGSVSVTVTGGTAPYLYTWSNGTGSNFTAGNYSVTITDFYGCTDIENFVITQPTQIAYSTNSSNLLCYQDNSGMVSITVNDGTPPYNYLWSTGATGTNSLTNIPAGTYIVTVTDANLCVLSESITITEPSQLNSVTSVVNNASCFGSCDGSANVTVSGGTTPYNYIWSNTQMGSVASGLCYGTYIVTVVDNNACTDISSVNISQPVAINISVTNTSNCTCFGLCNGTATVTASGGSIPYFYSWSTGGNGSSVNNLCAGNHTVTVTDANGCSSSTTFSISEPSVLLAQVTSYTDVSCYGFCDGSATLGISGGTPGYSVAWTGGFIGTNVSALCQGTYTVTITDANACSTIASTVINQPVAVSASIVSAVNPSCNGMCDGQISVSAAGGTPGYTYQWSNGQNASTITDLCSGNYSVTISDANNCQIVLFSSLTDPGAITVGSPPDLTICNGTSTTLVATASGGTPPYTFYWNNVLSNPVIIVSPASAASYEVYAVDVNGCVSSNTSSTTVYVTPGIQFEMLANKTQVCPGGEIIITPDITQGVPPYIIYDNQGFVVNPPVYIYPQENETYSYTAYDNCGSSAVSQVTISVFDVPDIEFSSDITSGCQPLTVSFNYEGQEMANYEWSFGSNDAANLSFEMNPYHIYDDAGHYSVGLTVVTTDGCTTGFYIENMIEVYPLPVANFISDPQSVTIVKPFVYFTNLSTGADICFWSFGDGDSSTVFNPYHTYSIYPTGTYNVNLVAVTNHGCTDTASAEIVVQNEYTFYAPSAFSPDNDAINDVFYVFGNGIDKRNFKMFIFDRWGEVIYNSTDITEGWDGRVKGGEMGKNGVYTWLVIYKDQQGIERQESGAVSIIR